VNRDRLLKSIKDHEGYRALPYKDSLGFWTIAWGHLLEDDLMPSDITTIGALLDRITDSATHEGWLEDDVDNAHELAMRWLGFMWNDLGEVRKEVVTEMAYQLGTRLTKFNKFRAAIADHDWGTAANEMLDSLWHTQTPKRAQELARRFRSETL